MRTQLALAALAAISIVSSEAKAQSTNVGGNAEINAFRPAIDSRGYITVNASQVLGHKELSFGLVTNWGKNVLTLKNGDQLYEVQNIISPTLVGAYGLKFGPAELELGLSLPFHVMSGDRSPDFVGASINENKTYKFDGQGLGDIGLHMKARFLSTSKGPKIGLGVIASVYLPTASEDNKWLGEGKPTPQVMGILDKEFGDERRLRLSFNGGVRLRSGTHRFVDSQTGFPMADPNTPHTDKAVEAGTSIPYGVALAYALVPQKFDLVAETFGAVPLAGENWFPAEAIAGVKLYLARNSFLSIGGGAGFIPDKGANPDVRAFVGIIFEPNIGDRDRDGLKDDVDQCPDDPEDFDDFEDEDGCPEPDNDRDGILDVDDQCPNDPEDKDGFEDEDGCPEGNEFDRDGDGILDKDDQCPDDPEDKDGFEDTDGCPDIDNDQDGILDVDDLCPDDPEDQDGFEDKDGCPDPDNDNDRILDADDQCPRIDGETQEETAETYNGNEDDDGCPDRGRVVVTDTKIEILDKIYFEYNKATIKSQSFPILDAIVATLEGNPDIALIEIQGHTDERGSDSYNLDLSDRRAASVRTYISDHGIAASRMQSQGYGETQPLDPKSNEAAWAKNRRVEFLILKRIGEK